MSGTVGYDNVKLAVNFTCDTIASGIRMAKNGLALWANKSKIVEEVKDTQADEVIDLVTTDVRRGFTSILEAIKGK